MTKRQLFFITTFLLTTLPAVAQLHVQYGVTSLTVTGASPGADVAVLGVIDSSHRGQELVQKLESIEHANETGQVTVTVARPSFRSVWFIVDLRTGELAISSPPGYQPRRTAVPPDAIERTGRSLVHTRPSVDIFVARRGVGAWHARSAEVGKSDPGDARLAVNVNNLKPVGTTSPPPTVLSPDDVVVAFYTPFMEFWATKLTTADLQAAQ